MNEGGREVELSGEVRGQERRVRRENEGIGVESCVLYFRQEKTVSMSGAEEIMPGKVERGRSRLTGTHPLTPSPFQPLPSPSQPLTSTAHGRVP